MRRRKKFTLNGKTCMTRRPESIIRFGVLEHVGFAGLAL